jgi:hypothetical protein
MNKNYEPTIEGHYEKCCDERDSLSLTVEELSNRIHELTAERDQARREVCNLMYQKGFPTGVYARGRGWDCFKEDGK